MTRLFRGFYDMHYVRPRKLYDYGTTVSHGTYSIHKTVARMVNVSFLILLVGVLTSSPAMAAWAVVDQDDFGASYIDLDTKYTTEDGVSVWTLYDSEVPTEVRTNEFTHSTRVNHEFNCKKSLARTLVMVKYSQRMAQGHVVEVKQARPFDITKVFEGWEAINPATGRAKLFKLVCTK